MEETIIHPETGEILRRDVRPVEYTYKDEKIIVNQPGWFPAEGAEGILSSKDWDIADEALQILKVRVAEKISQNNFSTENLAFA